MKPVEIEILMKGNLGRGLDDARRKAESLDSVLKRVGATVGIAFGTREAVEFARKIMEVRGEVESLQISFETLAGKTKGQKLFGDIREWVVNTPMMMQPVAKGAQTLLGFNIEAEKVMPILRQIGDISMGDAQKFNSLTLAFAQMSSTGKLMGQDLLQMINAGFNPLVVISEKTGKSMATLKKEMADGRITVKMVEEAFASATAEGGRFHGMLEKQSKGIKGAMSNLQGAWEDMLNDIGEKSQGKMVDVISLTQQMVKNYEKVLDVLAQIVVAYGAYKGALMAIEAIHKAQTVARMIKLYLTYRDALGSARAAQLAFNRAALVNPYVLIGAAAAGAAVSIYKMATADNAAEAAQKKLNKTLEDADKLAKDNQRELEELTRTATDEAASTDDRRTAMQQLVDKYPSIIQKYIDEKGHLTDIINLKREIARLDGQEKAGQLEEQTRKAKRYLELYDKSRKGIQLSDGERKLLNNLADEVWDQQSWWTQTKSGSRGNFVADYYQGMLPSLERSSARTKTENMLREYNNGLEKMTDAELEKMSQDAQNALKKIGDRNSAYLDSYTNDFLTRGDLAERLGVIGSILDKRHPANTTTTTTKTDKKDTLKEQREQEAKAIEEERRWQEKISGIKRDAADAQRDAEIAAIRDDGERERAEEEEQHRRRLRQIADEADEIRKAIYEHNKEVWENDHKDSPYELTDAGKAGWQGIQLSKDQQAIIDAKTRKENEEYNRQVRERLKNEEKAQKDILYQYLATFGDYEDKKTAIEKRCADEVYELEEKLQYAKTDLERASINAQIQLVKDGANKEKEALDEAYGKKAHTLGDLFGDLTKRSIGYLDKLSKKYSAFLQFFNKEGGVDRKKLIEEYGFTDKEIDEIIAKINSGSVSIKELTDRVNGLNDSISGMSSWKAFAVQMGTIAKKIKEAKKAGDADLESDVTLQALDLIGGKINETAGIAEQFSGILSSCFHVDESEVNATIGALKQMGNYISGFAKSLREGGTVGGVMFLVTSALEMVEGYFQGVEEDRQEKNQRQEAALVKSQEALKDSIDNLSDQIEKSFGAAALSLTEEKQKQQREAMNYDAQAIKKTEQYHEMEYEGLAFGKWYPYMKALASFANSYNLDYDPRGGNPAYADLWSILEYNDVKDIAEALYDLRETNKELWGELASGEVGQYFEDLANLYEEYKYSIDELREQLTTTTEEDVFSGFLDNLYKLGDESEDVFDDIADNWQKMVNKMAINNIIGEQFRDKLKHWYMALAKANEERSKVSEDATEEEIAEANRAYLDALDRLKEEYEGYVTEAQSSIEQLRELGIISATGKDADSGQSAKAGGFAAMSQDQGTKLDGMFTAGLQHWSSMDNELATVGDNIGKALDRLKRIEENTEYCRKLEEIAENIRAIKNNGVKVK